MTSRSARLIMNRVPSTSPIRDGCPPLRQHDHRLGQDFRLVSFDTFGVPQPLPLGLGNLPLYLDDDGFHSVNGPLDLTAHASCTLATPVNHDVNPTIGAFVISGPDDKKPSISPDLPQYQLNADAVSSTF
ncbi:hypothetical protein B9Z19DRAFT_1068029 [Tuber borchii]|uniref:Uncharacterized protein n=1 Tax=Tuber borchii TaxID=42251 RepID=A0A2T6ZGU5_TUBBO|nr:hypothetical protein B9Z19DRAFT_1068029 [Tuber borchii]